jgi:antitoxin component of RelBE/YafQ-DinJ toxin-antitoxin module
MAIKFGVMMTDKKVTKRKNRISVYNIPDGLKEEFEAICKEKRITMSNCLVILMQRYIEENKF